ncbi:MAG TPA: Mbeg1-like protein, partial [Roseovarius sp.]|nr:Mbeg1-like protein [Roseovarius sp.]
MTISKDLLLSILAMDAYNQGYDRGIEHDKTNIGPASVKETSTELLGSDENFDSFDQLSDFFALTYEIDTSKVDGLGTGEVIAFRGTDSGQDMLNGWTGGAGAIFGWSQLPMALEYYTRATGLDQFSGPASNVMLTGHSLGGGLAGFVSSVTGTAGMGLDHMPFMLAGVIQRYLDYADEDGELGVLDYFDLALAPLEALAVESAHPLETSNFYGLSVNME